MRLCRFMLVFGNCHLISINVCSRRFGCPGRGLAASDWRSDPPSSQGLGRISCRWWSPWPSPSLDRRALRCANERRTLTSSVEIFLGMFGAPSQSAAIWSRSTEEHGSWSGGRRRCSTCSPASGATWGTGCPAGGPSIFTNYLVLNLPGWSVGVMRSMLIRTHPILPPLLILVCHFYFFQWKKSGVI